jgi:hypothetical protein
MSDPQTQDTSAADRQRVATALAAATALLAAGQDLAGDPTTLAGILRTVWTRTYEAVIRAELEAAGQDVPATLIISNSDVVAAIEQHATETAQAIQDTLRREAQAAFDTIPLDTAPDVAQRLLVRWLVTRSIHKTAQVAITETATAAGAAQRDFIKRSGAKGSASFGYSLQCKLCQAIAQGNPYDLDDDTVGEIPHPSCLDYWRISYTSIATPWHGQ